MAGDTKGRKRRERDRDRDRKRKRKDSDSDSSSSSSSERDRRRKKKKKEKKKDSNNDSKNSNTSAITKNQQSANSWDLFAPIPLTTGIINMNQTPIPGMINGQIPNGKPSQSLTGAASGVAAVPVVGPLGNLNNGGQTLGTQQQQQNQTNSNSNQTNLNSNGTTGRGNTGGTSTGTGTTTNNNPPQRSLANYIAPCYMQRPTLTDDEKKERILIVTGLQPQQQASDLLDYINIFILAVTHQTRNQEQAILGPATSTFKPAFDCEIDYVQQTEAPQPGQKVQLKPVAKVYFRSFEGTQVALNLHELEYCGIMLNVVRPDSFKTSKRYVKSLEEVNWNRKARYEQWCMNTQIGNESGGQGGTNTTSNGTLALTNGSTDSSSDVNKKQTNSNQNQSIQESDTKTDSTIASSSTTNKENQKPKEIPPEYQPLKELPQNYFTLTSVDLQRDNLNLYQLFGIPDPTKISEERLANHLRKNQGKISFLDAPIYMEESQLRELFSQFGTLKYFELMLHPDGCSKGFGMLEYDVDVAVDQEVDLDLVFSSLNGFVLGDKSLKVQRLMVGNTFSGAGGVVSMIGGQSVQRSNIGVTNVAQYAGSLRGVGIKSISSRVYSNPVVSRKIEAALRTGKLPSRVVQLINAVYESDLLNDSDAEEIRKSVYQEACKFGSVEEIRIPRPSSFLGLGSHDEGVGKIFVLFREIVVARKFQNQINGRKFDDRTVCAAFFPHDRFMAGKFTLEDK